MGVSPIVAGRALKGPTDRMMSSLGHEVSAVGVARLYAGLVQDWVIDVSDAELAEAVERRGLSPGRAADGDADHEDRAALARALLDAASG